jgi:hypothetical protein
MPEAHGFAVRRAISKGSKIRAYFVTSFLVMTKIGIV